MKLPFLGSSEQSRERSGSTFVASHFHKLTVSPVALLPAADYHVDLADIVSRGMEMLGVEVRNRRVLLKPNFVEYEAGTMINTHPSVVAGTALACLRKGASEVVVGEGPGHRRDIEYLLVATGMLDHLRDLRLRFVDLNTDDVRQVKLKSHYTRTESLLLPVTLLESDFVVSMPKLKTHHWAGMTASLKNLFGVVPGSVYGWPKNVLHYLGIENSILDLAATIQPQLSVVDAITAMEGDGPIMGRPRHVGLVLMGTDLPAVDATCARLIGLDPQKLRYLSEAGRFLGNVEPARIELRGETLERFGSRFDLIEPMNAMRAGTEL